MVCPAMSVITSTMEPISLECSPSTSTVCDSASMLWLMAFICPSAVMAEWRPDSALKAVSAAVWVTSLAFWAIC
ncbi:hypothetical protein D3C81_2265820 [compost metagenome]